MKKFIMAVLLIPMIVLATNVCDNGSTEVNHILGTNESVSNEVTRKNNTTSCNDVWVCIITGICTLCAAISASILNDWLRSRSEKRKSQSAAKAILHSLGDEIGVGVEVLKGYIATSKSVGRMPTKSWETYWPKFTIGMIDVVLKCTEGKQHDSSGFPAHEFLTHLKNYYSYICGNVNTAIANGSSLPTNATAVYLQPSQDVLKMVSSILKDLA